MFGTSLTAACEESVKEDEIRDRRAFARYLDIVRDDIEQVFSDKSIFSHVACPACDGDHFEEAFIKAGFRYVVCVQCDTLFVNPRPSAEALTRFYLESPSSRYWIKEFFKPVAEIRREKIFRPRAQYVAERLLPCESATVGDIGAGFGLFLEELRCFREGFRLVAIEPSGEMAQICRAKGLEVAERTIELLDGYDGQFDLLTSFELLEHLYEPRKLLERVFRLLRPGGMFLATTLNGTGFDIQVLWERSKSVSPPHHLNFLNPKSFACLVERVGFVVDDVSTPGQLDWDIVEGAITKENVDPGRFWSLLARKGNEASKEGLQLWLAKHGFSSHMRLTAKKPYDQVNGRRDWDARHA